MRIDLPHIFLLEISVSSLRLSRASGWGLDISCLWVTLLHIHTNSANHDTGSCFGRIRFLNLGPLTVGLVNALIRNRRPLPLLGSPLKATLLRHPHPIPTHHPPPTPQHPGPLFPREKSIDSNQDGCRNQRARKKKRDKRASVRDWERMPDKIIITSHDPVLISGKEMNCLLQAILYLAIIQSNTLD